MSYLISLLMAMSISVTPRNAIFIEEGAHLGVLSSTGMIYWLTQDTIGTTSSSVDWSAVLNKPLTFTPSTHEQSWSTITDKPATPYLNLVVLSADTSNTSAVANTLKGCGNLSFPVVAGTTYRFRALIAYTSAITTTGSRWTITGPSATFLHYKSTYCLTATTLTTNFATAYSIPSASNASSLANGNIATIEGIVKPSANGTIQVSFASEVLSSAITARAGSTLEWW